MKKRQKISFLSVFLKRLAVVLGVLIVVPIILYFFVFPSIFDRDNQVKNILIVSGNLDYQSNYIYFAHISGDQSKNTLLSIPSQESVVVPGGYGEYPLQSVHQLLQIDKKDTQFIGAVFSELFGIVVNEVVTINLQLEAMDESELASFFLSEAIQDFTKLKFRQAYRALYLHYQTKNVSLFSVGQLSDLQKYTQRFATVSGDLYQHCSVAVVNVSGENGLARRKADLIETTGALVLRITDSQEKYSNNTMYYDSSLVNCKQLATHISGVFNQELALLPIEELEDAQQYRSKVVIFIVK